jgi:hypothetical protein
LRQQLAYRAQYLNWRLRLQLYQSLPVETPMSQYRMGSQRSVPVS